MGIEGVGCQLQTISRSLEKKVSVQSFKDQLTPELMDMMSPSKTFHLNKSTNLNDHLIHPAKTDEGCDDFLEKVSSPYF